MEQHDINLVGKRHLLESEQGVEVAKLASTARAEEAKVKFTVRRQLQKAEEERSRAYVREMKKKGTDAALMGTYRVEDVLRERLSGNEIFRSLRPQNEEDEGERRGKGATTSTSKGRDEDTTRVESPSSVRIMEASKRGRCLEDTRSELIGGCPWDDEDDGNSDEDDVSDDGPSSATEISDRGRIDPNASEAGNHNETGSDDENRDNDDNDEDGTEKSEEESGAFPSEENQTQTSYTHVRKHDAGTVITNVIYEEDDSEWLQSAVAQELGLGHPQNWRPSPPPQGKPHRPGTRESERSRYSIDTDYTARSHDNSTISCLPIFGQPGLPSAARSPTRSVSWSDGRATRGPTVRELKRRAKAEGFSEAAIEEAEDAADPIGALTALLNSPPR